MAARAQRSPFNRPPLVGAETGKRRFQNQQKLQWRAATRLRRASQGPVRRREQHAQGYILLVLITKLVWRRTRFCAASFRRRKRRAARPCRRRDRESLSVSGPCASCWSGSETLKHPAAKLERMHIARRFSFDLKDCIRAELADMTTAPRSGGRHAWVATQRGGGIQGAAFPRFARRASR